jgi:hypothetical protein
VGCEQKSLEAGEEDEDEEQEEEEKEERLRWG